MISTFKTLLPIAMGLLLFGCGGGGEETVELITVSGTVTYEGTPISEGTIQFENPTTGIAASSELSSDGEYSLEVSTGKYDVTVYPPVVQIDSGPDSPPTEGYKEVDNIPEKYRQIGTTDLEANVKEDGQSIDFDLKP